MLKRTVRLLYELVRALIKWLTEGYRDIPKYKPYRPKKLGG